MSIATFLFCGLLVGAVAQTIAASAVPRAWLQSMSLGVLGALCGGFFGVALGLHDGQPAGVVMALVGATMLVIFYHARTGRPRGATP